MTTIAICFLMMLVNFFVLRMAADKVADSYGKEFLYYLALTMALILSYALIVYKMFVTIITMILKGVL